MIVGKIVSTILKPIRNLLSNKSSSETWKTINKVLHPKSVKVDVDPDEVNAFLNTTAEQPAKN